MPLNKHCTPFEVDEIRNKLRSARIKDHQIARTLGVSRTQMNMMLNHNSPMRTVYRWAVAGVLDKRKLCTCGDKA